jgi:hypothetical protein
MLTVLYAKGRKIGLYAECRCAECRGANGSGPKIIISTFVCVEINSRVLLKHFTLLGPMLLKLFCP